MSPSPVIDLLRAIRQGQRPLWVDYPPQPQARWGHGRSPHPELAALLEHSRALYRAEIEEILARRASLAAIPVHGRPDTGEPYWINGFLPGLDAAALYTQVARHAPPRYVEIGSGHSTRFAARATRDHGLSTRIVCYDPAPRAPVARLAHEVHRARLEDLAPGTIERTLEPGDILFYDGSHRALENSDVTVFFLEVLPRLPAGVLVQVHDICLPHDYPPGWEGRWYSEQYVLAAYLLGGGCGLKIVLPNAFVSGDASLAKSLEPLWSMPALGGVERHGSSFWMMTTGR